MLTRVNTSLLLWECGVLAKSDEAVGAVAN